LLDRLLPLGLAVQVGPGEARVDELANRRRVALVEGSDQRPVGREHGFGIGRSGPRKRGMTAEHGAEERADRQATHQSFPPGEFFIDDLWPRILAHVLQKWERLF